MKISLRALSVALALYLLLPSVGLTALEAVSEGVPADGVAQDVVVSLANGLPIWYEDDDGLRLAQCLDQLATIEGVGTVDPCEMLGVFPLFPPSLANLAEVLYWQAATAFNYNSRQDGNIVPGGLALLVLALEGAGANELPFSDGNQAVFSRIRLRIDLPIPGTYQITHPFGTFTYEITDPGRRSINQTQDVGVTEAQNFLASMRDRNIINPPVPFFPDINAQVVNADGATIGPFLVPDQNFDSNDLMGGPVTATNGAQYIGLPFGPGLAPIFQPVEGVENNFFRIELLNPPADFFLNAGATPGEASQTLEVRDFQVVGKIFNPGANQAPTAPAVTMGVLKGRTSVDIDVFAGLDAAALAALDPIDTNNVHGIDTQAVALAHPVNGVFRRALTNMPLLTQAQPTAMNSTVRRITHVPTGQSLFRYSVPQNTPAGFSDVFHYVAQDTGGLMSAPAQVTVVVEDLRIERADFRVKTGQWLIRGTTDSATETISLTAGPQARLEPLAATAMSGQAALLAGETFMDYRLIIQDVAPQTTITEVNLHVEGVNNPIMFRLCGNPFIFPFPPACSVSGGVLDVETFLLPSDLLAAAGAAGILNFVNAVDAVLGGNAYINVITSANPLGELRGAIVTPEFATATVDGAGGWEFRGKARLLPGLLPNVTVRSSLGVQTYSTPVRWR